MSKEGRKPKAGRFSEGPERVLRGMQGMKGFQRLVKAGQGIQDEETRVKAITAELEKIAAERGAEEVREAAGARSRLSRPKPFPYRNLPPSAMVVEIAAVIAAGDPGFMLDLNEEEALHWLDDYMAEVAAYHGPEAVAQAFLRAFDEAESDLYLGKVDEQDLEREFLRRWKKRKRVLEGFQRLLDARNGIQDKDTRVQAMVKEYRKMKAEQEAEETEEWKKIFDLLE